MTTKLEQDHIKVLDMMADSKRDGFSYYQYGSTGSWDKRGPYFTNIQNAVKAAYESKMKGRTNLSTYSIIRFDVVRKKGKLTDTLKTVGYLYDNRPSNKNYDESPNARVGWYYMGSNGYWVVRRGVITKERPKTNLELREKKVNHEKGAVRYVLSCVSVDKWGDRNVLTRYMDAGNIADLRKKIVNGKYLSTYSWIGISQISTDNETKWLGTLSKNSVGVHWESPGKGFSRIDPKTGKVMK